MNTAAGITNNLGLAISSCISCMCTAAPVKPTRLSFPLTIAVTGECETNTLRKLTVVFIHSLNALIDLSSQLHSARTFTTDVLLFTPPLANSKYDTKYLARFIDAPSYKQTNVSTILSSESSSILVAITCDNKSTQK